MPYSQNGTIFRLLKTIILGFDMMTITARKLLKLYPKTTERDSDGDQRVSGDQRVETLCCYNHYY